LSNYIIKLLNQEINISSELLHKYDKVGPRYTSYPTAPEWTNDFKQLDWLTAIEESNKLQKDISLYFHIPFCKSACYYCACNFVVSPQNKLAWPYLKALSREIKLISKLTDSRRKVKQLHFGGGTPTYLSVEQINYIVNEIKDNFNLNFSPDNEFSIEIDPRVTSFEHLKLLKDLGFNRVSMGIQDFDPSVQKAVNRIQSYEMVSGMVKYCRELGFESINFDLIYGLPCQSLSSFTQTLEKVTVLNPDRIALFNYAHLPSLRPFQKAYINESALPKRDEKFLIFCQAMKVFAEHDYEYIGMDHFAKRKDELCLARTAGTLHRNFQGYTTKAGCDLFGLGMTSISSIHNTYNQNEKRLTQYMNFFDENYIEESLNPLEKGFKCSPDDLLRRKVINNLLCHEKLLFDEIEKDFKINFNQYFKTELLELDELAKDNLIIKEKNSITVTSLGRIFLRNIAMPFDIYLQQNKNHLFSRTV